MEGRNNKAQTLPATIILGIKNTTLHTVTANPNHYKQSLRITMPSHTESVMAFNFLVESLHQSKTGPKVP